jgi:hypothetical protein
LKAIAATGVSLVAGDFLRGASIAQEAVKVPEAEKIVITVITDTLADLLRPDYKIAKRHRGTPSLLESASYTKRKLAYQIETVVNGESHS